jgi:hypothetical protein
MSGASAPSEERRQFLRAAVQVPASAVRRNASLDHSARIVNLRIVNLSRGGIGANAPEPLFRGEPVVVFFPPMGSRRGRDSHGRVVRCTEVGGEHYVGIAFEPPWPEHEPLHSD